MAVLVIHNGKPIKVSTLDRGRLLIHLSEGFKKQRLMLVLFGIFVSFMIISSQLLFIRGFIFFTRYPELFFPNILVIIIFDIAAVIFFSLALVDIIRRIAPNRPKPGIYERGVQLMGGPFIPFEEIKVVEYRERPLFGYLALFGYLVFTAKYGKVRWTLPFRIVEEPGVVIAMATVRELHSNATSNGQDRLDMAK